MMALSIHQPWPKLICTGQWAWPLADVVPTVAVPVKGKQRLWPLPDDVTL